MTEKPRSEPRLADLLTYFKFLLSVFGVRCLALGSVHHVALFNLVFHLWPNVSRNINLIIVKRFTDSSVL
jgi:hypothetical protein